MNGPCKDCPSTNAPHRCTNACAQHWASRCSLDCPHDGECRCAACANAPPRLVIIESPYAGDVARNLAYLRACLHDSLRRGEAPMASHGLYTQPGVLKDDVPQQRALGIAAGLAWGAVASATVVYTDLGITTGMRQGIEAAHAAGRTVVHRSLGHASANAAVTVAIRRAEERDREAADAWDEVAAMERVLASGHTGSITERDLARAGEARASVWASFLRAHGAPDPVRAIARVEELLTAARVIESFCGAPERKNAQMAAWGRSIASELRSLADDPAGAEGEPPAPEGT